MHRRGAAGIVVVACLAAAALTGSCAVPGGAAPAAAEPASPVASSPPLSSEVLTAIEELQENRAEIVEQHDVERAAAAEVLHLPPGTAFGDADAIPLIDAQIEALRAENGAELLQSPDYPVLYWYEEGYFASLMAIDWKCAWLSTGVAAVHDGDTEAAAAAVEELRSFVDTTYAAAFVDYDVFLERHAEPLLQGDVSGADDYLPSCVESALVG